MNNIVLVRHGGQIRPIAAGQCHWYPSGTFFNVNRRKAVRHLRKIVRRAIQRGTREITHAVRVAKWHERVTLRELSVPEARFDLLARIFAPKHADPVVNEPAVELEMCHEPAVAAPVAGKTNLFRRVLLGLGITSVLGLWAFGANWFYGYLVENPDMAQLIYNVLMHR
jgi:hypothetical protein